MPDCTIQLALCYPLRPEKVPSSGAGYKEHLPPCGCWESKSCPLSIGAAGACCLFRPLLLLLNICSLCRLRRAIEVFFFPLCAPGIELGWKQSWWQVPSLSQQPLLCFFTSLFRKSIPSLLPRPDEDRDFVLA